jgi:short-subunit dehydrogenase
MAIYPFNAPQKAVRDGVAVITGAGGGIGRQLALNLARQGCHLALVDINAPALLATADLASATGVRVSQHVIDITDQDRMAALPQAIADIHGGIDFLINNAGITLQKSFAAHSMDDLRRIVDINLWGVLYGCHYFLPYLRKSSRAHIVNLSSMNAFLGMPSRSTYCLTKAAVRALSEALWAELAREAIGVTCVHPGAIRTDMIMHTLQESEDLAVAQRNYELAARIGMDASKAASSIIDAMRRNRLRVRVGADAVAFDVLKRLLPVAIHYPFKWLFQSQMKHRPS